MQLYQVQMQIIMNRDGWTSSTGLPMFFVFAQDARHAEQQAKSVANNTPDVVLAKANTKVRTAGAVCIARFNAFGSGDQYGMMDVTGEDYRSWADAEA